MAPASSISTFALRALVMASVPGVALACGETMQPVAAPVIRIVEPTSDAVVRAGDTVLLRATLEGDATVAWYADDVAAGTGLTVPLLFPDPGAVIVTAGATSADGLEGRDSQTLEVLTNSAPVGAGITLEPSGRIYATDTLTLVATGMDPDSTGYQVAWHADQTQIGTGNTLRLLPGRLGVGLHRLLAVLRDPQGLADTLEDSITVVSTPGRLLWTHRVHTGSADRSLLALRPDGVILAALGTQDPECRACLVAVSPAGEELWRTGIGGPTPPNNHSGAITVASDNTTYVMDFNGDGFRLSTNGDTLWHTPVSGFDPHGRFALSPSGALFASGRPLEDRFTSALARLSPAGGSRWWQMTSPLGSGGPGPFIAADGNVAAGLGGYLRWASPNGDSLSQGPDFLPATYSRGAMGADGSVYAAGWRLEAFAPDGTQRWVAEFGLPCCVSSVSEPAVGADGTVYVATATGTIAAVDPADGSPSWTRSLPTSGGMRWLALTADGGVLVNDATRLYALDAASGAIRWSTTLANPVASSIAVAPDGTIYLITSDGRVTAVRGDAGLDLAAPWPAWRADNQRTSSVLR